jgi:hypothetical protein
MANKLNIIKIKKLKLTYEKSCNNYVDIFCKKQDMNFEGWIGSTVGGIAVCNDFYFNFEDIVYDVNNHVDIGNIIEWYYDNLQSHGKFINYYSYNMGLRIKDLKIIKNNATIIFYLRFT